MRQLQTKILATNHSPNDWATPFCAYKFIERLTNSINIQRWAHKSKNWKRSSQKTKNWRAWSKIESDARENNTTISIDSETSHFHFVFVKKRNSVVSRRCSLSLLIIPISSFGLRWQRILGEIQNQIFVFYGFAGEDATSQANSFRTNRRRDSSVSGRRGKWWVWIG